LTTNLPAGQASIQQASVFCQLNMISESFCLDKINKNRVGETNIRFMNKLDGEVTLTLKGALLFF
jgi:hypothetical protein